MIEGVEERQKVDAQGHVDPEKRRLPETCDVDAGEVLEDLVDLFVVVRVLEHDQD